MSNILQSGRGIATDFAKMIKESVDLGKYTYLALTSQSNLLVVDQLNAVCSELGGCYGKFKGLVVSDADSIAGLQEALEEFDTALSISEEVG